MLIFRRSNCIVTTSGIVTLCTVHRFRADSRPLTESDDTWCCNNTIWPPEDERSIARNLSRIIMQYTYYYRVKELCIKLVIETSLYHDARSEKYQIMLITKLILHRYVNIFIDVLHKIPKYYFCQGFIIHFIQTIQPSLFSTSQRCSVPVRMRQKVNWFLCTPWRRTGEGGGRGLSLFILNLSARWRFVVSFTSRPF